jgi:hypothetical protein
MTSTSQSFARLSDDELLATVKRLAHTERRAAAALVRSLMELDVRRLYLGEGYSSLFTYCTQTNSSTAPIRTIGCSVPVVERDRSMTEDPFNHEGDTVYSYRNALIGLIRDARRAGT